MDYKQADSIVAVLNRIAEALEDIDGGLAGIEDALSELRKRDHG